eukprot:Skav222680  [mRNA]  locus=scaffold1471:31005:33694:- [translate_table: standard]
MFVSTSVWAANIYPLWFKYVKGPFERYQYEHMIAELRGHGLMLDRDCFTGSVNLRAM